jgi:XTP/dITP diphosphohydrolase
VTSEAPGRGDDVVPAPATASPQVVALARAVAVMDRLRSAGGCPWIAQQTHGSLAPFVVDEAHELVEAVEAGDRAGMREELGDVLQQVLFHARVAAEDADDPFDLADVADALVAKLVRRTPHVFAADGGGPGAPGAPLDARAVHDRYEQLKRVEKASRTSALDGVPPSLGAVARAQKLLSRADRAGLLAAAPLPVTDDVGRAGDVAGPDTVTEPDDAVLGEQLLALVATAHRRGLDAEGALRRATAAWEASARAAETRT